MNVEVVVDGRGQLAGPLEVWLWTTGATPPTAPVSFTDDTGRATFTLETPGPYRLVMVTPGPGAPRWVDQSLLATWGEEPAAPRTLHVRLDAASTPRLRLLLKEGLKLKGQLVGEQAPLSEATVLAIPLEPPWGKGVGTAREVRVIPDAAGHFLFEDLQATQWLFSATAPGQELDVRSSADTSHWREGRPWVLCHPLVAEQGLHLTLRHMGRVTGRVLGAAGLPLERFAVNGHRVTSTDGRFMVCVGRGPSERLTITAPGHAGRTWVVHEPHSAEPLALGDVALETGRSVFVRTVDARTGEDVVEAVLTPLVPGVEDTAEGRLGFHEGSPEDWWPGLEEERERMRARRREAGGEWLEHVASECELLVTAEGYVPMRTRPPADATHWEARLSAGEDPDGGGPRPRPCWGRDG